MVQVGDDTGESNRQDSSTANAVLFGGRSPLDGKCLLRGLLFHMVY